MGAPRCASLRFERAHAPFPSLEVLALPCPFGNFLSVPSRLNFLYVDSLSAHVLLSDRNHAIQTPQLAVGCARRAARPASRPAGCFGARRCLLARRPCTQPAQKQSAAAASTTAGPSPHGDR